MGAVEDSLRVKKAGPRPASRELRSDIMDYHSEAAEKLPVHQEESQTG
jgi:hypothetical protein